MHKIIIVDDEKLELEALRDHINWGEMGIQLAGTAKNGREALQAVEELKPDIVLTDVKMPIMDGLEFAKKAKASNRDLKIIFLSGYDEFLYVKAAMDIEATGYLLKPVDISELQALIDKIKARANEDKLASESVNALIEKYFKDLLSEKDLNNIVSLTDMEEAARIIEDFYRFTLARQLPWTIAYMGFYHLLISFYELFEKHDASLETYIGGKDQHRDTLSRFSTPEELKEYVLNTVGSMIEYFKGKNRDAGLSAVNKILSVLELSYQRALTIEDLAKEVYLSPNYVRTIFKEKTGETILEYLTRLRMKKASELLLDKSLKIHEIAALVGYENVSYFCSVFQKNKGITPNEYRKKLL